MNDSTPPETLDGVLDDVWYRLAAGVESARHAFHLPVLASVRDGEPEARTVVLRLANRTKAVVCCHADVRSPKFAQVRATPRASWLFYDRAASVQVRLGSNITTHRDDALADERWSASRLSSKRCYLGAAPSGELLAAGSGLPPELEGRVPDEAETRLGRENFGVIVGQVDRIDWLSLHHQGHRRAAFRFSDGTWQGSWLAP